VDNGAGKLQLRVEEGETDFSIALQQQEKSIVVREVTINNIPTSVKPKKG
jgi:hypothetical protein